VGGPELIPAADNRSHKPGSIIIIVIIIIISAEGIIDTEGEEKNWLENVNVGMTISPGGLPPQNCCGAR